MKELSIEEKAKAYDELKVKLQELTEDGYIDKLALLDLFPELKESEDERIRKELIEYFRWNVKQILNDFSNKECLAWLEKQGEQKFEQKFFINDKVVHKATGKIWTIHHYLKDTNSYYVEDNDGLLHHYIESELKLIEQKPAWSGEDEYNLAWIVETLLGLDGDKEYTDSCKKMAKWLKSLKDRYTWKPSDEQMKALEEATNKQWDVDGDALWHLYQDLKKLREE